MESFHKVAGLWRVSPCRSLDGAGIYDIARFPGSRSGPHFGIILLRRATCLITERLRRNHAAHRIRRKLIPCAHLLGATRAIAAAAPARQ
jgi:hypothetical protein